MSKYIFAFFTLLLFVACDSNRYFEENKEIQDNLWKAENEIPFEFEIKDSTEVYNVLINIRNAGHYEYANLYLFLTTTYPDNSKSVDTVNCILQNAEGKWLGEGLGDIWDNRILFKPNVVFKKTGKYTISFQHAMRKDPLPMIMDVGLRIEKVN